MSHSARRRHRNSRHQQQSSRYRRPV